jgi:hypothetical protein
MRRLLLLILVMLLAVPAAEGRRRRRSKVGKLLIESSSVGALVLVDGVKRGAVPLPEAITLKPGKHTLKLSAPGHTQYLDVFVIKRGKTTKLSIDLLPIAGILKVASNLQESKVFIDGKYVGMAPVRAEALIGKRTVKVMKAGFYDVIKVAQVIAGHTLNIAAEMKPLPIGSSPYQPAPPPPPKWYEKWYVWTGVAGAVVATTLAIVLPVTLSNRDICGEGCDYRFQTGAQQ